MNLTEALSIPYIRSATSVYDQASQSWKRRFEYAELPNCAVVSDSTLQGLDSLERKRILRIIELMREGAAVPSPRAPLHADVGRQLQELAVDIDETLLTIDAARARESAALAVIAAAISSRLARDSGGLEAEALAGGAATH